MINEDTMLLCSEKLSEFVVAVIGDYRLDYNYIGLNKGLSRENEALVVFDAERVTQNPGGGANLAVNLTKLGVRVVAVGIVGSDVNGDVLFSELEKCHIDTSYLVREGQTGVFAKQYFPSGVHVGRSNIRASKPSSASVRLLQNALSAAWGFDAIAVADYDESGCGIVDYVLGHIGDLDGIKFGMSRSNITKFAGYDFIVCNQCELLEHVGLENDAKYMPEARKAILGHAATTVVTLEGRGAAILDSRGTHEIRSFPLYGTIDPCGAGDSFTAALVVAKLCGYSDEYAVMWANSAARWTCRQLYGVGGYPTPRDIYDEYLSLYRRSVVELNLEHLRPVRVDTNHEWGTEYWLANCELGGYGAKILEFHTGFRGSEHSHGTKDEILIATNTPIVVYTRMSDNTPPERHLLGVGAQLRVLPGLRHMIVNESGQTAYIFEVSNFEDEQTTKFSHAGRIGDESNIVGS